MSISFYEDILAKGYLPDYVIRFGIRKLLQAKLSAERKAGVEFAQEHQMQLINKLKSSPIAVKPHKANEQHYEVPTEFFQLVLGKHLKYSSGYWRKDVTQLDQAEADMLAITCERADLRDGQTILELGCGWGSLSLFMAQRFPNNFITALCNSRTQKDYIDAQITFRGLKNLHIIMADMNEFKSSRKFDRIVSVKMFEHMRNYEKLLEISGGFLNNDGKLFTHIFAHKDFAYLFEDNNPRDFIGKYFFTGGIMPSDDLLLYFQKDFAIDHHWRVSGAHYQRTAECWLANMDNNKDRIMAIFHSTYGAAQSLRWWNYWRVFFMTCAELWGYDGGSQWMVSHYRFVKR